MKTHFDLYTGYPSTYQGRWGIEDYHKSLKNNVSLQKPPTKTVQTQRTYFLASLCAYVKLERLKTCEKLNHFASPVIARLRRVTTIP